MGKSYGRDREDDHVVDLLFVEETAYLLVSFLPEVVAFDVHVFDAGQVRGLDDRLGTGRRKMIAVKVQVVQIGESWCLSKIVTAWWVSRLSDISNLSKWLKFGDPASIFIPSSPICVSLITRRLRPLRYGPFAGSRAPCGPIGLPLG